MVLLVNRTHETAKRLLGFLNPDGKGMDVTRSVSDALRLVRSKPYSLVLLEWIASDGQAFGLLHEIRKTHPSVVLPVIVLAPTEMIPSLDEAYDFGANDVIGTSVSVSILQRKIETFVDAQRRIAELKRLVATDKLLGSSGNPYKIVADYSNDWEVFRDPSNHVVYCSPSVESLLGYTVEEYMAGVELSEFVHPGDYERVFTEYRKLVMGEVPNSVVFRVNRRTGESIWVETFGQPIYDAEGKFIGFRTSSRDVTRTKEAELALKESEEKYKNLVQFMDEGIIRTDRQGNINLTNNGIAKIFEYASPEEMIGRPITELYPAETRAKMGQAMGTANQVSNYEIFTKTRTGREIYLLCNIKELLDEQDQPAGREGIIRDITKLKHAELTLRRSELSLKEANATKDKFISILAHDLKGPFSGLMGLTRQLMEYLDSFTKEEILDIASLMNQTSTSTYLLLEELLEWARMQSGSVDFHPKPIPLSLIINDCVTLLANQSLEKKIKISSAIPEGLQVHADGPMLRTILRNLLTNSIKFTPMSGSIKLDALKNASMLEISVADTGMGMDSRTLQSLFKIGETRSRIGTNGERGTGFGLLLCKEFVEKHGGTMDVESVVGEGSVFRFSVPSL